MSHDTPPGKKLAIGTAQFGMNYGIANQRGQTPAAEVARILEIAAAHQVGGIDTAPAYGTSETILGQVLPPQHRFNLVTKTPRFAHSSISRQDAAELEQTFYQSLQRLRQKAVYGLLIHHVDDLLVPSGDRLIDKVLQFKAQGLVKKIGISVYTETQISAVLEKYNIDLIQLPINVFDQRLLESGCLRHLRSQGVEIHARSVFLQGLLMMAPEQLPEYFRSIQTHFRMYLEALKQWGKTPLEAALEFVVNLDEIDATVIGIDGSHQLLEILGVLQNFSDRPLSRDYSQFALMDHSVLNPANWKL